MSQRGSLGGASGTIEGRRETLQRSPRRCQHRRREQVNTGLRMLEPLDLQLHPKRTTRAGRAAGRTRAPAPRRQPGGAGPQRRRPRWPRRRHQRPHPAAPTMPPRPLLPREEAGPRMRRGAKAAREVVLRGEASATTAGAEPERPLVALGTTRLTIRRTTMVPERRSPGTPSSSSSSRGRKLQRAGAEMRTPPGPPALGRRASSRRRGPRAASSGMAATRAGRPRQSQRSKRRRLAEPPMRRHPFARSRSCPSRRRHPGLVAVVAKPRRLGGGHQLRRHRGEDPRPGRVAADLHRGRGSPQAVRALRRPRRSPPRPPRAAGRRRRHGLTSAAPRQHRAEEARLLRPKVGRPRRRLRLRPNPPSRSQCQWGGSANRPPPRRRRKHLRSHRHQRHLNLPSSRRTSRLRSSSKVVEGEVRLP